MLDETRWPFHPGIALDRPPIALVIKGAHESGIEFFGVRRVELGRDVGEIEIDPVALGSEVDAVEVANALGMNHRGDGATGDAENLAFGFGPLRVEARIHHHEQATLALAVLFRGKFGEVEGRRIDEHLGHGPAVDVHFVVSAAFRLHFDEDRGERPGNGRRGDHHVMEQLQGARMATGGDARHVPDDPPAGVEIGS